MEMDWMTATIGLISIVLFVSPFVLMHYKSKNKENQLLQGCKELAEKHHGKITQHEFCGDLIMGLDEQKDVVFFYTKSKEEEVSKAVNLSGVLKSHVIMKSRSVKTENENRSIIDTVELHFLPKDKSTEEVVFKLFDENVNHHLSGEIQFAEKWSKLINQRLRKR